LMLTTSENTGNRPNKWVASRIRGICSRNRGDGSTEVERMTPIQRDLVGSHWTSFTQNVFPSCIQLRQGKVGPAQQYISLMSSRQLKVILSPNAPSQANRPSPQTSFGDICTLSLSSRSPKKLFLLLRRWWTDWMSHSSYEWLTTNGSNVRIQGCQTRDKEQWVKWFSSQCNLPFTR
jgi:hypothetical protein